MGLRSNRQRANGFVLPDLQLKLAAPAVVLAAENYDDFVALSAEAENQKGGLRHVGYFLKGPEVNYVLLCLRGRGENP